MSLSHLTWVAPASAGGAPVGDGGETHCPFSQMRSPLQSMSLVQPGAAAGGAATGAGGGTGAVATGAWSAVHIKQPACSDIGGCFFDPGISGWDTSRTWMASHQIGRAHV